MAGIHVSGGTYSGSGDVTCDWVWLQSTTPIGNLYAPEGTLTTISEQNGYAFDLDGNFYHQSGTLRLEGGVNTSVDLNGDVGAANPYNVIIDNSTNTVEWAKITTIENDLTIISGTFQSYGGGAGAKNIIVSGNVDIGSAGGTAKLGRSDGWGGASVAVEFGSLNIGAAGIYYATSGTTTLTDLVEGSYAIKADADATFVHNSGTITCAKIAGGVQELWMEGQDLYNLNIAPVGGTIVYISNNSPGLTVANDLNVTAGKTFKTFGAGNSRPLTVSGMATISGTLGVSTETSDWTFGALDIKSGGTYIGTSGTTNINASSRFDGSASVLCWTLAAGGTFTPNGGTVNIHCAGGATPVDQSLFFSPNTGSFYDLEVQVPEGRYLYLQSGDDLLVDNDLTIQKPPSGGAVGTLGRWGTTTGVIVVGGTATIEDQGKIRWSPAGDNPSGYGCTFGLLNIEAGGIYDATAGETIIKQPPVGAGKFYNLGTFTHNNGTVVLSGASQEQYLGPNNASITFYDLELKSNEMTNWDGAGGAMTVTIENSYNSYNANRGMGMTYTNNKLILGSATGACTYSGSLLGYNDNPLRQWYVEGANELYPAIFKRGTDNENKYSIIGNTTGSDGSMGGTTHVKWVDFSDVPLYLNSSSADGDFILDATAGSTIWNAVQIPTDTKMDCSGQRADFGGLLRLEEDSELIVSGAMILVTGAGGFTEHNNADVLGLSTATLWTDLDSGVTVSPAAGNTAPYFKNVFWAGEGRINQDRMFGDSNLICAGTFDGSARPVGHNSNITKRVKTLIIPNGGTYTNTPTHATSQAYVTGSFSNRGGLFASGGAACIPNREDGGDNGYQLRSTVGWDYTSLLTNMTVECWVKLRISNYSATYNATVINREDEWGLTLGGTDPAYGATDANELTGRVNTMPDNNSFYLLSNGILTVGKWHHIALVFDGSEETAKLYLDAKLVGSSGSVGTSIRNAPASAGYPLLIGGKSGAPHKAPIDICELRIWNTSKTQQELMDNMFIQAVSGATGLLSYYPFDEISGNGLSIATDDVRYYDVQNGGVGDPYFLSGNAYGASDPSSTPKQWAVSGGTWTAGNKISSSAGNLYIGNRGTDATVFGSSYFPIGNRSLIEGAKFASKAHEETYEYYIATSGANDYLLYAKLSGAPIGVHNDVKIVPPTTGTTEGSYFTFDANADNEQCNTLVNYGGSYVRILTNEDFYTQDFDNQGTWVRNPTYDGIIHDDGSTPHEYNPIDIMDDQDSGFDAEDLID